MARIFDSKNEKETDRTILEHVMDWYGYPAAQAAIAAIYPDTEEENPAKWRN